jgi:hypothetical protein
MTLALHFGVYPREGESVFVAGHDDPSTEHAFLLTTYTHGIRSAFVSGSWGCWGPADQETDGDDSLHVLVVLGTDEKADVDLIQDALLSLVDLAVDFGRVLDYAIVSSAEDWSEDVAVATFVPSGKVYLNATSTTVESVS